MKTKLNISVDNKNVVDIIQPRSITQSDNRKSKQASSYDKPANVFDGKKYKEILDYLTTKFPDAFVQTKDKILKIGVHKDLKEQTELSSTVIRKFLRKYCKSAAYKKALQEGASRFDLQGNIAGTVVAEETENNKP